jgi:hypothetical protein
MFLHREDMQPFDTHGKEGVDMIVQTDTVECEKAGRDSLLAARTHPFRRRHQPTRVPCRSRDDRPSEQNFGINSGETSSRVNKGFMHGALGLAGAPELKPRNGGIKIHLVRITHQCAFRKIAAIRPQ